MFVVQILNDINNNYNGLKDTKIHLFNNFEDAQYNLLKKYEKIKFKHFLSKDNPLETDVFQINNLPNDSMAYFELSDGNDYFSGRVISKNVS